MAVQEDDTQPQRPVQEDLKPAIPDYLATPNAVFGDEGVQWRYGRAPDYSKTRKVWAEGKRMNHEPGSLPEMVENLVKNWEVEASFKPRLSDWRTIDHEKYSFAMGGGAPQSAEHMIQVGTYNGIIAPNEYYSPENSDFASSHKTFKRMMPTFAWEVLEVYSGPPRVAFRWRHWGVMKNDYVGFNDKGEKVTAKAHGGLIDIQGVTVATVDDKVRLQDLQTWMDPLEMFRQIAPGGVVNRSVMNRKVDKEAALDLPAYTVGKNAAEAHDQRDDLPETTQSKHVLDSTGQYADAPVLHVGTMSQNHQQSISGSAVETGNSPQPAKDVAQSQSQDVWHDAQDTVPQAQSIVDTAASQGAEIVVNKPASNFHEAKYKASDGEPLASEVQDDPKEISERHTSTTPHSVYTSAVTGDEDKILEPAQRGDMVDESKDTGARDAIDDYLERSADEVHPQPKDVEKEVQPNAGEAVAAAPESDETRATFAEMSRISASECPFLMNRE
ncbi:hypothetical protein DOTSEDRAFT_49468 [Dothistroma septosporum NZE10]|uniref:Pathogen-related protein n=1 Tax=Dothistroma septosporum (strain NZE10 / CBS 128990) TaxID=675120 RepID=N1Q1M3_DOTSN|nr:hypothetical protein DOTSEDRAFT_49468 [Dothistroma septosporum NZE10]